MQHYKLVFMAIPLKIITFGNVYLGGNLHFALAFKKLKEGQKIGNLNYHCFAALQHLYQGSDMFWLKYSHKRKGGSLPLLLEWLWPPPSQSSRPL